MTTKEITDYTMLRNKDKHTEPGRPIIVLNDTQDSSAKEESLRLRRELVNAAIEVVGYDPIKIEQYLSRKHVA